MVFKFCKNLANINSSLRLQCSSSLYFSDTGLLNKFTTTKIYNMRNGWNCFPSMISSFHSSGYQKLPDCELTVNRYPVKRGSYSRVCADDINFFKSLLDDHRVITDESELKGFNTDWHRSLRGFSSLLLKPKTTKEVSDILQYCNYKTLAVCPQGGNTGMAGGSVPIFDEIIISTSLMNKIESLDEFSGGLICQAGCVLEQLDQYVNQHGLMMPLDLGAKGSCQIGGNISTNAGGLRLMRYGNLHGSVLGVEAVLASGEVIDCLSNMRKDNTGYGLQHLFIGSEGTLGIVTKVSIQCPSKPSAVNVAFLGLDTFDDVLTTFKEAKSKLGEVLSSCEFIDDNTLDCVTSNLKLSSPIGKHKFYMLIETSGSNSTHDEDKLSWFLESALESGIIKDGALAKEPSKVIEIWNLRERVADAWLCDGYNYLYDISVPLQVFYKVVEIFEEKLKGKVTRVCGCGHLGDGNLHLCVTAKEFNKDVLNMIEPYLYELTAKYKGSISAEHGLGFKKKDMIHYSKSDSAITLMRQLKHVMDPKGILNPYKVLPKNTN